MKRLVRRFVGPLLVGACVCTNLGAGSTQPAAAADSSCDFIEFAVGMPSFPIYEGATEGRIDLHTATGGGQVVLRSSLGEQEQLGDQFGAAIALADLDGDNCVDVVVGAPGVDGGGAVYVIFGTAAGVGTGPSMRIPFQPKPGDAFGDAIAVEALDSPKTSRRFGRIWIGAPGRDVSGQADAGAVVYTEVVDRVASTPRLYTQNSGGVPGQAEPGDRFGEELAALGGGLLGGGVLVGQPSEDIDGRKDAGMVTVLPAPHASPTGPGPYSVTQDTPGIPGAVEAGDRFGAAVDAFMGVGWVGVPDEDFGAVRDVGMVHGLRTGATEATSIISLYQGQDNGVGIPGRPEAGDRFGASVRGGQLLFTDGSDCYEPKAVIGVPGEDVGTATDAGEADYYLGGRHVDCGYGVGFNLGANAHPGDHLGAAVAIRSSGSPDTPDELLLGIPGYDVATAGDAGVVLRRLESTAPGDFAYVYTQTNGASPGAHYGSVFSR